MQSVQSMQKRGKAPQNHGFTELPRSPALHTPAYPAHLYRKPNLGLSMQKKSLQIVASVLEVV